MTDNLDSSDTPDESLLAHLTGWFRQRPTSMEYWELLVTDERLVWCFVGESFKSMLLRADTGERRRQEIENATPQRVLTLSERNFAVPLAAVESIRLRDGSLFRRAALTVEWETDDESDSFELHATKSADSQVGDVEALQNESALSHVAVEVETSNGLF
ncbi:hypothetical protein SAMN05421858_2479 [Haladaptatus litoreus]|uniref:Uncharacterized protein n=2 Tax=Haladaptatus litoreus TaxID=553468 RepID=A0A1N7BCN2_9EURY|nr:hypothetical protein SAMN05421858_2479 [Haladaptatus litoreus]